MSDVLACGLVTALGYGWRSSAAAMRAGLSRPWPLELHEVPSLAPVTGYAARHLTEGKNGAARLGALLQGAVNDLLTQVTIPDHLTTSFYLAGPEPERGPKDEALTDILTEACAAWPGQQRAAWLRTGRTAFFEAIRRAQDALANGRTDLAVIGGVDSLCEGPSLLPLLEARRIKNDDDPTGLMPGEAAALLLLVSTSAQARARLGAPQFAAETRTQLKREPSTGVGLERALSSVLKVHPSEWLLVDQNGEDYRAGEWGFVLPRLIRAGHASPELWFPAISLGDTGAAAPAVSAAWALAAWDRGYAPESTAVLCASGDHEARAACALLHV